MSKQPKKWTEVYPQGTKEGDEESQFFKALARHPKWDWRSVSAIQKGSGLPQQRVEEILQKYATCKPPLVYPHPTNENHWGYWEREEVKKSMPQDTGSISCADKDNRIDDYLDGAATQIVAAGVNVVADVDVDDDDLQDCIVVSAPAVDDGSVIVANEVDDWVLDV